MRQIVEHGMARRLRNVWMHRKPECPESHKSDPVPVMIPEFSPALFLLAFGFFVALCLVLGEKIIMRHQKIRDMNDDDNDDSVSDQKTGSTNSASSQKQEELNSDKIDI